MKNIFVIALLLVSSMGFAQKEFAFEEISQAPLFDNCTTSDSKKCFQETITTFVNKNFNTNIAKLNNLKGKQRVITEFVIDENGRVQKVSSKSTQQVLVVEMKRVMSLLPKLQPAMKDGKTVKVQYVLPVEFKVSGNSFRSPDVKKGVLNN